MGGGLAAGAVKVCPQLSDQWSPSAEVVAKECVPAKDGEKQRQKKIDHAQPCKQDIEKAQCKIDDGIYLQVIVPMLRFHASALTFTSMQPTGQSFAHLPQPTQRSASTAA